MAISLPGERTSRTSDWASRGPAHGDRTAAACQLRLLGSPQLLYRSGAPVRWRTKKHLALLVYLHLEGRGQPVRRDALTELLWPHAPPAKGRHSLSQALVAIRERLGAEALTRREHDVRLVAPLTGDMERLRAGDLAEPSLPEPLLGIEDCGGAEFSHWVDGARARLRGEARAALRAALKAARSAGDLPRVHRLALALHGADPLCADAVQALAERALLDGDAVTAVRLLKDQIRRADAELGTNPNPEIVQLLQRLERGERPAFAAQGTALPARLTRREVFVGREVELSRLEGLWDRVRGSGYQTCLLTGAPGIGKSSLVRRFALSLAARAWPAFVVPCQEIGQGIPYAAVSDLILALAADPRASGTDPGWLAEGSRVCPGLRAVYPGIPPAPEAPTDSIRLRVAEAVLRMMEAVSDGAPMLIAFDDLQFMDPASREVLFLVTRRLERSPVLLLAGARAGIVEALAAGREAGLPWTETVPIAPLDGSHTLQLISDLCADAEPVEQPIRETIVRLAGGNPYYIEMLLSDWRRHQAHSLVGAESAADGTAVTWHPPENLRMAFAREYTGLSADAQHVLQVLAVAGRALPGTEIRQLLGAGGRAVDRASLELLDRGVVRVEQGGLAFKNELHRAYVYYAMGEERRGYFHSRLGQALAASKALEEFQRVIEASHHFICARMPAEACETALVGAELAVRRGAPGEAERALEALLRSYPQDSASRVHLVLANALVAQEKFREAIDALDRWNSALPPVATDNALVAQLRAEALHRGRLTDDDMILRAATSAVDAAAQARADLILIRALQVRAEVAAESGRLNEAVRAGAEAERVAEQSASPEAKALASLTGGYCLLAAGRLEEAASTFSAAAPLLKGLGLLFELWRSYNGLGICFTGLARLKEAVGSFAQALAVARKVGDDVAVSNISNNLGVAYHEGGCLAWAAQCYPLPERLCASPIPSRHAVPLFTNAARLAMETGNVLESERLCALSLSTARESRAWRLIVIALLDSADLSIAKSELESAWPCVREALDLLADRSFLADRGQFMRLRAHMYWATSGLNPMDEVVASGPPQGDVLTIPERLEFQAFVEWITGVISGTPPQEIALRELIDRGLFGVLSRLLTLGVKFRSLPQARSDESAAQLIARVFQPERRLGLPPVDKLLQQVGVLPHSA